MIRALGLVPLPREGGWYRETHRSSERVAAAALPARFQHERSFATAIHYLLTPETCSRVHRLPADELYFFHDGDPVRVLLLHPDGSDEEVVLGTALDRGQRTQCVVPAGSWQGSVLEPGGAWGLLGVVVTPGFEFADYEEPADPAALLERHPARRALIERLMLPQS
ncbi:MAG: cupin domain-containing protein [Candidatus Eisenbacteria bacterium]|uniref:Cupin domain-containing protein n=1 Tax=Eiseniibacteriota bacterium TaxID=2212470 RepID=A0A849SI38_UNCEI|nr:cupin domain-containing protein [Candidatus Eisenbacteria bacterium]